MNENAFNPTDGSAVEEFAVDVEVDGSEILEISIRIFIGSKTQIPNVLLSNGGSYRNLAHWEPGSGSRTDPVALGLFVV